MSIYDVDESVMVTNQLPISKRKARNQSWMNALLSPIQWLHNLFFDNYVQGTSYTRWDALTIYGVGDQITDWSNIVWECVIINTDIYPTSTSPEWIQICNDFRGVDERILYNSQKIKLEYILNHWFHTVFHQPDAQTSPQSVRPEIFIDNIALNNSVFVVFDNDDQSSKSFYFDVISTSFVQDSYDFNSASFSINVPTSYGFTEVQIRSEADKYVIAGVQYSVIFY